MALSGEFWMQFLISFILAFVFLHLLNAPLALIQILFCFILAFDLFGSCSALFVVWNFPAIADFFWWTYTSPDLFLPFRSGHSQTLIHLWTWVYPILIINHLCYFFYLFYGYVTWAHFILLVSNPLTEVSFYSHIDSPHISAILILDVSTSY